MNGIFDNIKNKSRHLLWLGVILLAVVSAALFVILNFSYFWINGTADRVLGVSKANVLVDYRHLLLYLQNPFSGALHFKYLAMSPAGQHHFSDVKKLFILNNTILVVAGTISWWRFRVEKKNQQLWRLLIPMQTLLVVFPVICVGISFNFNQSFIRFHEIVFNNHDWVFNPHTDPIINVLTEPVFLQLAVMVVFLIELQMFIIYLLAYRQVTLNLKNGI